MISKDDLSQELENDKAKEEKTKQEELETLANDVVDKLETANDVLEFIDILKALVAVKGLVL